jgi:hypothetical protein
MSWRRAGSGATRPLAGATSAQARVGAAGGSLDELIGDQVIGGSPEGPLAGVRLLPLCYQHIPNHVDPSAAWFTPEP